MHEGAQASVVLRPQAHDRLHMDAAEHADRGFAPDEKVVIDLPCYDDSSDEDAREPSETVTVPVALKNKGHDLQDRGFAPDEEVVIPLPQFDDSSDEDAPEPAGMAAAPVALSIEAMRDLNEVASAWPSPFVAQSSMTTGAFVVREIEGRGRGLVALRDIPSGEQLVSFAAYSHTLYEYETTQHSYPSLWATNGSAKADAPSQCCCTCLRWSNSLAVRCEGCPAVYCSEECRAASDRRGHQLCCAALGRIHQMTTTDFSPKEKSTACFLLRAFAQRASELGHDERNDEGTLDGEPLFQDAIGQCLHTDRVVHKLDIGSSDQHRAAAAEATCGACATEPTDPNEGMHASYARVHTTDECVWPTETLECHTRFRC